MPCFWCGIQRVTLHWGAQRQLLPSTSLSNFINRSGKKSPLSKPAHREAGEAEQGVALFHVPVFQTLAKVPDPLPGQIWCVAIFPRKTPGGENNSSPELQHFRDQAGSSQPSCSQHLKVHFVAPALSQFLFQHSSLLGHFPPQVLFPSPRAATVLLASGSYFHGCLG